MLNPPLCHSPRRQVLLGRWARMFVVSDAALQLPVCQQGSQDAYALSRFLLDIVRAGDSAPRIADASDS